MCRLLLYDPTVNSLEHVRINAELILNGSCYFI